ncbi:SGNH/GDSL hydrolase family protein [Quisquiliibacterium transsilvanicum]|uniref:Lysophospholipase L1-like esterase n=1 Tax=Quisquiliibacterium transsilvanicum TaxID=1549638 RepID=A0A7W8M8H6_9BURK|nr:SGNH/GDSL hydrolase family protein [Quisquiliibacterium transsilvanicum]MBB5271798.1 lysophospholipase L1-like esterase [Quisquiliibacterium transsilvanicum]
MLLLAAKLALAPLLILQGSRVRRLATRLPEAAGEREALLGSGSGGGEPLRLLIVGDSATAGVGAAHQREALAGRLAERLLERLPARAAALRWRLVARCGATTADALALLEADAAAGTAAAFPADVAVLAVGVNDVTGQLPVGRWLQRMEAIARRLEREHGVRLLVISGLPPMHLFPALPQPLRWYLGASARRYDRALRKWASRRPRTVFVPLPAMTDPALMASDGFHPGPPAYRAWADALAAGIVAAGIDAARAGRSEPAPVGGLSAGGSRADAGGASPPPG